MLARFRRRLKNEESLVSSEDPHPAVALAVGLIYIFRTAAGMKIMRDLETAVRRYAADPQALWRLVRESDAQQQVVDAQRQVIDTTLAEPPALSKRTE